MDFIAFLRESEKILPKCITFKPISLGDFQDVEKEFNLEIHPYISQILFFSNGVIINPFTLYGIKNKRIADILKLNMKFIKRDSRYIYFSCSEHINFSYNVDNGIIYKQDYSEIAPELIPIAKNFDDFFSSVATKISYIVDNDLSDEIYTFEDEELPENLRKWPISY